MEQLKEIYEQVLEGKKVSKLIWFKATSKELKRLNNEIEKFSEQNYRHAVDNYALNHIKLRHGIQSKDKYPITSDDFLLIPQIVFQADERIYTEKDRIGNHLIVYKKRIGNWYYYIEEIRTGRKELACKTMYKSP